MAQLKLLLGLDGSSQDDLLLLLLEKASDYICGYCRIRELAAGLEGALLDLAVIYYNRLGTEGEVSRSEGGVGREFGSLDQDLPKSFLAQLSPYVMVGTVMECN